MRSPILKNEKHTHRLDIESVHQFLLWPWLWPYIFQVKCLICYIPGKNGPIDAKRKTNISIEWDASNAGITSLLTSPVTNEFDRDVYLWTFLEVMDKNFIVIRAADTLRCVYSIKYMCRLFRTGTIKLTPIPGILISTEEINGLRSLLWAEISPFGDQHKELCIPWLT